MVEDHRDDLHRSYSFHLEMAVRCEVFELVNEILICRVSFFFVWNVSVVVRENLIAYDDLAHNHLYVVSGGHHPCIAEVRADILSIAHVVCLCAALATSRRSHAYWRSCGGDF